MFRRRKQNSHCYIVGPTCALGVTREEYKRKNNSTVKKNKNKNKKELKLKLSPRKWWWTVSCPRSLRNQHPFRAAPRGGGWGSDGGLRPTHSLIVHVPVPGVGGGVLPALVRVHPPVALLLGGLPGRLARPAWGRGRGQRSGSLLSRMHNRH